MQRTFSVVLVPQAEGGYFVDCPSLPGCHSQGETKTEALANIVEAIELTLEDMAVQGEPLPPDLPPPVVTDVRIAV
jgi:predicted RNase H-like HicB family nuclease